MPPELPDAFRADLVALDRHVSFALTHPWALEPSMCRIVAAVLARRIAAQPLDPAALEVVAAQRRPAPPRPTDGAVVVIPIHGVIAPRLNLMSDLSGGTTCDVVAAQTREAIAGGAGTIVYDIDSPGGNIAGVSELHGVLLDARTKVKTIGQVEHTAASAAYWIASACGELVATPSAMVGSLGVFLLHEDVSAALEAMGIKHEFISAGKYKTETLTEGPLGEDTRAYLQALVDATYDRMMIDVAHGRGVTPAVVRKTFGEGRLLTTPDALAAKMIDRRSTLTDTLARVTPASRAAPAPAPTLATSQELPPVAAVTDQERPSDRAWRNAILAGLYERATL